MKRVHKVFIFICFAFTVRLVISCCNCNSDYESFDLTQIQITSIDNTGPYPQPANDTLYRNAIAFEFKIGNDQMQEFACNNNGFDAFNKLMACDCEKYYKLNHTIDSITVITNWELSFVYKANSDLTNKFYATEINSYNSGKIYQTLDELVEQINNNLLANSMVYKFIIVLDNIYINRNIALFTFTFHMSNGEKISGQTPEVYLTE